MQQLIQRLIQLPTPLQPIQLLIPPQTQLLTPHPTPPHPILQQILLQILPRIQQPTQLQTLPLTQQQTQQTPHVEMAFYKVMNFVMTEIPSIQMDVHPIVRYRPIANAFRIEHCTITLYAIIRHRYNLQQN